MRSFPERLKDWRSAALDKLRRRSWRAWLVVVGLGYVLAEVVRARVSDAGTLFLVWVFNGLKWVALQPMGIGGLALLLLVLALIFLSWWETRPRPAPREAKPEPVSDSERRLIQDVRTIWSRHGRLAVSQLRDILRDAVNRLDARAFWSPLLNPIVQTLDQRINELDRSLDSNANPRIADVRERFNAMYDAYIQAMRWVAQLQAESLFEGGQHRDDRFKVWQQNHRDMYERLQDLSEDPDHRGTMRIFMQWIDNPAFREFLRDAQTSPAWLRLMTQRESSSADVQVDAAGTES